MVLNLAAAIIALTIENIQHHKNLQCGIKILNEHIQKTDHIFVNLANISGTMTLFQQLPVCNIYPKEREKRLEIRNSLKLLRPTFYLIELTDQFSEEIHLYAVNMLWNPRAKFIFLTTSNHFNELKFSELLKTIFIQQFILIRTNKIYGWKTLDLTEIYRDSKSFISFLGNCSCELSRKNLFERKFFSNFNFLKVKAGHLIFPPFMFLESIGPKPDGKNGNHTNGSISMERLGIEVRAINTIAKSLKFQLVYKDSPIDTVYHIADRKIDILFGKDYRINFNNLDLNTNPDNIDECT